MVLTVKQKVFLEMTAHSRKSAPLEACGYLAGRQGVVEQLYLLTNMDQAPDHFTMNPAEQFRVIRKIRKQGLALCAVYHSHPETSAWPSEEDVRLAADPHVSYVIVSLSGKAPSVRSFTIRQGEIREEQIELVA